MESMNLTWNFQRGGRASIKKQPQRSITLSGEGGGAGGEMCEYFLERTMKRDVPS